jgi:hypothetical protein
VTGAAVAQTTASDGGTHSVTATTTAPVGNSADSQSNASFGGSTYYSLPAVGAVSSAQGFSNVVGSPNTAAVNALLTGHSALATSLSGATVVGAGVMGSSYGGTAGSGTAHVFSGSAAFNYSFDSPYSLSLGFLGMNAFNGGFDSLEFTVVNNGSTIYSHTFTTLADATSFFTDQTLGLGTFSGGLNMLVEYDLTASSARGMDFSYLVATAPVPEPEIWALMLVGLGMLGIAKRRAAAINIARI